METHRVIHDIQDLSYEDIVQSEAFENTSVFPEKRLLQAKPYPYLFAALAFGLFLGYLAKRN